ncbi:hypothetical protein HanIR_Chr10g0475581 [Helianthus annuus]|nr:hypothetical protein HanIR_Chr10g0475581 [Helianthus annuus]
MYILRQSYHWLNLYNKTGKQTSIESRGRTAPIPIVKPMINKKEEEFMERNLIIHCIRNNYKYYQLNTTFSAKLPTNTKHDLTVTINYYKRQSPPLCYIYHINLQM